MKYTVKRAFFAFLQSKYAIILILFNTCNNTHFTKICKIKIPLLFYLFIRLVVGIINKINNQKLEKEHAVAYYNPSPGHNS